MKTKTKESAVGAYDQSLQQFRDFAFSRQVKQENKSKNQRPEPAKKLIYYVHFETKTTTFFVAEDKGDNLFQLSQKEIKMAKQVIEETFRPHHSIDGHAGTIVHSGGYRLDLQGYIKHSGTKWANVQLQYGMRRAGSSNTYAQVLIPTEDPIDCSHDTRTKALYLSLEHRVAVWVRTVPASPEELRGIPYRDDFTDDNASVNKVPKNKR